MLCEKCIHRDVCGKCAATGGIVKQCVSYIEQHHAYWKQRTNRWHDGKGVCCRTFFLCSRCGWNENVMTERCKICGAIMSPEELEVRKSEETLKWILANFSAQELGGADNG